MLIFEKGKIGDNLLSIRKRAGLTQADVAERSGLSDRTYADIERGTVNMRIDTLLRICSTLHITPNDILTEDYADSEIQQEELLEKLLTCSSNNKKTALQLLSVYLQSLE